MATSSSNLPNLSDESVEALKTLRKNDPQGFYAYVLSLRHNGWPLRAIATPLGVSRSIVSIWEGRVLNSTEVPETEKMPEVVPKQVKPVYKKFQFTEDQQQELELLAHEASKVRRFTDYNSLSRKAAATLEELLIHYRQEGASLSQMADACKVSRSSIAQRLRKYE